MVFLLVDFTGTTDISGSAPEDIVNVDSSSAIGSFTTSANGGSEMTNSLTSSLFGKVAITCSRTIYLIDNATISLFDKAAITSSRTHFSSGNAAADNTGTISSIEDATTDDFTATFLIVGTTIDNTPTIYL